jgi:chemotaxis protein MotB
MSASRGGRRGRHGEEEHGSDERWLLTYADMITLLMALFMVLFSISSVNISKFKDLQHSLQDAFSGRVLPGGRSIKESGGSDQVRSSAASLPSPNIQQVQGGRFGKGTGVSAAAREEDDFQKLKRRIDAYAAQHGLSTKISTTVDRRGLHVRVLTDKLFFASGSADIQPPGLQVVGKLSELFAAERAHPLQVEGHTDPQPIHSERFPTNWELSAARASSVVRSMIGDGVSAGRLSAVGRAYLDPIADNDSEAGRAHNRRVEFLLPRQQLPTPSNPTPGTFPEPHFGPTASP